MNTRRTFLTQLAAAGSASLLNLPVAEAQPPEPAENSLPRWWPQQAKPKSVVQAKTDGPSLPWRSSCSPSPASPPRPSTKVALINLSGSTRRRKLTDGGFV